MEATNELLHWSLINHFVFFCKSTVTASNARTHLSLWNTYHRILATAAWAQDTVFLFVKIVMCVRAKLFY